MAKVKIKKNSGPEPKPKEKIIIGDKKDFEKYNNQSPLTIQKDSVYRNDLGISFKFGPKPKSTPKPKELPTVFVSDKSSSRIKKYNDSLNLYNTSLNTAKALAIGFAKKNYDSQIKYGISKKIAQKGYKEDLDFYNKQLVNPTTKREEPDFGGIEKYTKGIEDSYYTDERDYYKKHKSPTGAIYLKGQSALNRINRKIKPVAYSTAAELPTIPIYKKPVQPVEYREPIPVSQTPVVQPTPVTPSPQVSSAMKYDGEPVYHYTDSGKGLIGFMKNGSMTPIDKEDYDRFAVSKESRTMLENKQLLDSYMESKLGKFYKK